MLLRLFHEDRSGSLPAMIPGGDTCAERPPGAAEVRTQNSDGRQGLADLALDSGFVRLRGRPGMTTKITAALRGMAFAA